MISVDGKKLVLDGPDGVILKELSYLVCALKVRMMSRGHQETEEIKEKVKMAYEGTDEWKLDELRTDAGIAAERQT